MSELGACHFPWSFRGRVKRGSPESITPSFVTMDSGLAPSARPGMKTERRAVRRRSPPRLREEIGLLVEQRHAECQKHGVDVALVLGDQDIELAFPVVLLVADAEGDAIGHAWTGGDLLHERHDHELAACFGREISGERTP